MSGALRACGAPGRLRLRSRTPLTLTLEWEPPRPAEHGGSAIAEYAVQLSTDGFTWGPMASTSTPRTHWTCPGLAAGTKYWARAKARNVLGWGPCGRVRVVGRLLPPSLPPSLPGSPRFITCCMREARFRIQRMAPWLRPATRLQRGTDSDRPPPSIGPHHTWFRPGPPCEAVRVRTAAPRPPAPPGDLALAARSPTTIDLRWSAPIDGGGAGIEQYVAEATRERGEWSDALRCSCGGEQTGVQLAALLPATDYYVRVRARTRAGVSAWSRPPLIARTTEFDVGSDVQVGGCGSDGMA